jgi:hypothetical protein
MLVTNIPRRQIYECLLEYEEKLLELQILVHSQDNFAKYFEEYKDSLKYAKQRYKEIKALLIMFFENKTFTDNEEFAKEMRYFLVNEEEVNQFIKKNKNLSKEFKTLVRGLDKIFEDTNIKNLKRGREIFEELDNFNSKIPKILELRRDKMKN